MITNKKAQDWRTPQAVFNALHADYLFTIDGAASEQDAKLLHYTADAFNHNFLGARVFCNPPFGQIDAFLRLARYWAAQGSFWCLLLPANLETDWFLEQAIWGDKHTFRRRVAYEPPPGIERSSPSFSSMTCMFGPDIRPSGLGFSAVRCGKTGQVLWRNEDLLRSWENR